MRGVELWTTEPYFLYGDGMSSENNEADGRFLYKFLEYVGLGGYHVGFKNPTSKF